MGTLHETENLRTGSYREEVAKTRPLAVSKAQGCWLSGPFLVSPIRLLLVFDVPPAVLARACC